MKFKMFGGGERKFCLEYRKSILLNALRFTLIGLTLVGCSSTLSSHKDTFINIQSSVEDNHEQQKEIVQRVYKLQMPFIENDGQIQDKDVRFYAQTYAGTVAVAIFSMGDFDATTVDPMTVTLAGAGVALNRRGTQMASSKDVNRDGLKDLVVHFQIRELELNPEDTMAVLEGETFDETPIRGTDTIRIISSKGKKPGKKVSYRSPGKRK